MVFVWFGDDRVQGRKMDNGFVRKKKNVWKMIEQYSLSRSWDLNTSFASSLLFTKKYSEFLFYKKLQGGMKLVTGPRQNPYMLPAAFTGSKEQKKKCQYCETNFYVMVSHGYDDRRLSSGPVICLQCNQVISGLV